MSVRDIVAYAALAAGAACFLLYIFDAVLALLAKPAAHEAAASVNTQAKDMVSAKAISVDDFTKLIEAMSKLTDSLSKAGPSLTSLIGAILLFAIAAVASGAITSPPTAPAAQTGAAGGKSAPQAPPAEAPKPKGG